VSLAQVESMADAVWPGMQHAVISIPDARKGEQLVLVTAQENPGRDALSSYASRNGITALAVPATLLHTDKIPVLGSGKTDFQALRKFIAEYLEEAA
jgi:acyl-[acyl-carrier-protein]-phospholipid O-acyltransferase / long-chain-fatty-acid--[acyl-carrier-protein] ligase